VLLERLPLEPPELELRVDPLLELRLPELELRLPELELRLLELELRDEDEE
jgi:hypothetical protein